MMFRATTPTHIFALPFDTSRLQGIRATYVQDGEVILQKTEEDCTLEGTEIRIQLTQEETLLFQGENRVQIQLRVLTTDGKVMASDIGHVMAKSCLDEEVMS